MIDSDLLNDERFKEFLKVMKPRKATKSWANEDTFLENTIEGNSLPQHEKSHHFKIATEPSKKKRKVEVIQSEVQSKKRGGEGIFLKKKHMKFQTEEEDAKQEQEVEEEEKQKQEQLNLEITKDKRAHDKKVSDLDWLKGKAKPEEKFEVKPQLKFLFFF
jgi:hypothetical protein